MIGTDGKVVTTFGPAAARRQLDRRATAWCELREGRGPTADDEIAVNAALAKAGRRQGRRPGRRADPAAEEGVHPGRHLRLQRRPRTASAASRRSPFTEPVAQQLMLGEPGVYTSVDVTAGRRRRRRGAARRRRRRARRRLRGQDRRAARRGRAPASFRRGSSFFNNILLGFAGVALFVGIFLILNTFSIIVAQRTRELALMRALGASRAPGDRLGAGRGGRRSG